MTPPALNPGDLIAITSPASIVDPRLVNDAAEALRRAGFNVRIMPHALSRKGSFAGTLADRFSDLREALLDPDVKAILCSRGGYGCIQLLNGLQSLDFPPKWLIGFSDITALHAMMLRRGIISIHSSMAKALATQPAESPANSALLSILRGATDCTVSFPPHSLNRPGQCSGQLIGGNIAVFQALMSTPFDIFANAANPYILFIEDISEPIYRVNRMLWQMRMAGVFERAAGIVIGQFTNYRPDDNYPDMYAMLSDFFADFDRPIAFNAPIGHFDSNMPVPYGAPANLSVNRLNSTLTSRLSISTPDQI